MIEGLLAADRIHGMGSGLMLPLADFMRAKLSQPDCTSTPSERTDLLGSGSPSAASRTQ